jgi:hypothetical protein
MARLRDGSITSGSNDDGSTASRSSSYKRRSNGGSRAAAHAMWGHQSQHVSAEHGSTSTAALAWHGTIPSTVALLLPPPPVATIAAGFPTVRDSLAASLPRIDAQQCNITQQC